MPLGYPPPAPPARPRGTRTIVIVLLVVVVLIVAVIAVAYVLYPAPPVQVQAINIWAPDNVCGLNANGIYFGGFNSSASANQTYEFGMPNFNYTTCTVVGVTTNTSGFSLFDVQVPLTIAANGTSDMNITIQAPSSFSGDLNLVLS
jgi:hypothetical protein